MMANVKQDVMASKDESHSIREQETKKDLSSSKIQLQTNQFSSSEKSESHEVNNSALVDVTVEDKSSLIPVDGGHIFEYRHQESDFDEKQSKEDSRSIFEIRHHRQQLSSLGNERPDNCLSQQIAAELGHLHNETIKKSAQNFFPPLVAQAKKEESLKEKKLSIETAGRSLKKGKKARQLCDYYNNPEYLEQSRRSRRRKQSEVDIEVGNRLSRFVRRPYEGSVDKYSKKFQSKPPSERKSRAIRRTASSSTESSPLGSSSEQISAIYPSPLVEYNEEEFRSYLWSRRGLRRRSLSFSPPRLKVRGELTPHYPNSVSQTTSPSLSPSPSVGPASPALARYRKTTFATILNSADKRKELDYHHNDSSLPLIHLQSSEATHKIVKENKTNQPISLSHSLTSTQFRSLQPRHYNCITESTMNENNNHYPKKIIPKNISPSSLRKQVLLNTSVPSGSPTFQRAMQGFHYPKDASDGVKKSVEIRRKPPVSKAVSPQPHVTRPSSAGGQRKTFKQTPSTPETKTRPRLSRHVSFRGVTIKHCHDEDNEEAISEMRDQLTNLKTSDVSPAKPSKSILKNRRRSIDDLDVGTKKGLALYFKSKQLRAKKPGPR